MEDEEPLTSPAVKNAVNFFNNLNNNRVESKPKPRPRLLRQTGNKEENRNAAKNAMNLINQLNGELKANFEGKVFKQRFKGGSKEKLIGDDEEDRSAIVKGTSNRNNKPDLVSEINEKPKPLPKPKPRMNILQNKAKSAVKQSDSPSPQPSNDDKPFVNSKISSSSTKDEISLPPPFGDKFFKTSKISPSSSYDKSFVNTRKSPQSSTDDKSFVNPPSSSIGDKSFISIKRSAPISADKFLINSKISPPSSTDDKSFIDPPSPLISDRSFIDIKRSAPISADNFFINTRKSPPSSTDDKSFINPSSSSIGDKSFISIKRSAAISSDNFFINSKISPTSSTDDKSFIDPPAPLIGNDRSFIDIKRSAPTSADNFFINSKISPPSSTGDKIFIDCKKSVQTSAHKISPTSSTDDKSCINQLTSSIDDQSFISINQSSPTLNDKFLVNTKRSPSSSTDDKSIINIERSSPSSGDTFYVNVSMLPPPSYDDKSFTDTITAANMTNLKIKGDGSSVRDDNFASFSSSPGRNEINFKIPPPTWGSNDSSTGTDMSNSNFYLAEFDDDTSVFKIPDMVPDGVPQDSTKMTNRKLEVDSSDSTSDKIQTNNVIKNKIETFNSILILKSQTVNPLFTTDRKQILEENSSYSKSTKYSKPENSILIVKSGSTNELCDQKAKPKAKKKVLERFVLKNREALKESNKPNVIDKSKGKFPRAYKNPTLDDQFEDIDKIFKDISYSPIRNSQSLEDLRLGEKSLEDSIKQTKANIKQSMQCLLEFEKEKSTVDRSSTDQHFLQAFKKSKRSVSVDDRVKKVKNIEPYDTFDVGSGIFRESALLLIGDRGESADKSKKPIARRRGIYKKIQVNVSHVKERSDAFLEPYLHGLGDRQSPAIGAPSPSPPPACRIAPFLLPAPASRSPSRESLISSNGGSEAGSEDSGDTGYGAACDIGLLERLRRSHPIWFLPGIQRAGAFHLLQGKEEGCFVVRQSSQPDTMALSVRLPPDKGPYIEHYLIQSSSGRLGLETSENRFDDIPALIAHYANCCDELPVQLTLPKAIREARSRQQLSSYALLGQEFWRYSPPPSASSSPDADLVLNLNPLMSTFKTAEPSTPVPKDSSKPARPNTLNLINNVDPKCESSSRIEPIKCIPSFKNELASKTPPPPPPRWSKPTTPQNNITVTTTVTFSVNSQSPRTEQAPNEINCDSKRMSPEGQTSTMSSKGSSSLRRGPETVTSPNGSILSPNSDSNSLITPDTLSPLSVTKTTRTSRRAKHKVSKHYQESDILESPTVYYRSAVGDKISDYEDLWSNDHSAVQKNKAANLASPDLLQHTGTVVSLNNNILSPTDSQTTGSQRSHCSTPNGNQHSNISMQSPISDSISAQDQNSPKQSSPFYAEPADSLAQNPVPRRIFNRNIVPVQQRHSNPAVLISHSPMSSGFDKIDPNDFNGTMSSSVDNLSPKQRLTGIKKPEIKPVLPPSIKPKITDTWQVDNSWKFVGNDADMSIESSEADYDSDWPVTIPNFHISPFVQEQDEKRISIQEMISRQFPDIRMSNDTTDEELSRMSAYDNVDDRRTGIPRAPPSEISELTEFSDPWAEITPGLSNTEAEDSFSENCNPPPKLAPINRKKSFKDRMDPLLSAPRLEALRSRDQGDSRAVGAAIRNFALGLATDKSTTFAQNIDNFIACTKESREENPKVVMRNMRQFMSGMKNYLVKHGERGFDKEVERERNKLKSTEFLNIDAILEGVLHCLVVTPLKSHLHKLFINKYTKTGAIRLLADSIQYANTRPISELAIKPKISLPSEAALQTIQQYLNRLQAADSPLEKLEYLFAAIATIFNSVKTTQLTGSGRNVTLGADDFLPLFVWVLVKTNFVAAEIEAEYMWGLLHPSLLSGEGGYYLTTLLSAVHVLKNFKESNEENVKNNLKSDSVLKVVVPDELHGSILTKTLPARPHMTTKEVCKIIAHKARITNPQDFALYRLVDGEETLLGDNECPQDFMCEGKHVMLAYKRIDAKIAWPKQQSNN